MSRTSGEAFETRKDASFIRPGSHIGYVFSDSAEKQVQLFRLCAEAIDVQQCYVLYIAGKQGVKGIRLSLKDTGFDVAAYERARNFRIVDSEEWYLEASKHLTFKRINMIHEQMNQVASEASSYGKSFALIISETDQLVRKGFYQSYRDFDSSFGTGVDFSKLALLCAFDEREVMAQGVKDVKSEIRGFHAHTL